MNVTEFAAALEAKFNARHAEQYPTLPALTVTVIKGRKFAKIMNGDVLRGATSIHCFVDVATGEVYKPAGLKAPAKGVRFATMDAALEVADTYGAYLYR